MPTITTHTERTELRPLYVSLARHFDLPDSAAADLYCIALAGVRANDDNETITGRVDAYVAECHRQHDE